MPETNAYFLRMDDLLAELAPVSRREIDDACREWRVSGGKSGLPHCRLGRGFLFRRPAVESWVCERERVQSHAG